MELVKNSYSDSLNSFCVVGVNYRKSDMTIRERFSLSPDQSTRLLEEATVKKIGGCLTLSTCNRTEVYGISPEPDIFTKLLCHHTNSSEKDFSEHGYMLHGIKAIEHLFKVASGLDSQIIGDYEILSQLKQSAKVARDAGCLNTFMERAINYALQVSKEIKTKTKLSSGTVSVSYAAIEIIKSKIENISGKKILLVGTGKFGNHIAQNLRDYLPSANLSFTNRTDEKAIELAKLFNGNFIPYMNLAHSCGEAEIIIVSSSSPSYSVVPGFFNTGKPRLILDLSVPQNVHPDVKNITGTTVLNVDEVSVILNKTIKLRKAEIPKALKIINETLASLESWHQFQHNSPLLRLVKSQLFELNAIYFSGKENDEKIHRTVSSLALKLKEKDNRGCLCIHALSNYLT